MENISGISFSNNSKTISIDTTWNFINNGDSLTESISSLTAYCAGFTTKALTLSSSFADLSNYVYSSLSSSSITSLSSSLSSQSSSITSLSSSISSQSSSITSLSSTLVNLSSTLNSSSSSITIGSLLVNSQITLNQISEKIYNSGTLTGTTLSLDWSNGASFYATPFNSTNLSCTIANIPTTKTYCTYNFSVILDTSTYKVYVSSLSVNGTLVTLTYVGGSSSVNVSSASFVLQNFVVFFTSSNSSPWKCLTYVNSCS
jgi:hypothetical protein